MTTVERLHHIIKVLSPDVAAAHEKNGTWPPEGCPYSIETLSSGSRRVSVTTPDGDRRGAIGATVSEAVATLEAKVLKVAPAS